MFWACMKRHPVQKTRRREMMRCGFMVNVMIFIYNDMIKSLAHGAQGIWI
jgi:hypothetical protein